MHSNTLLDSSPRDRKSVSRSVKRPEPKILNFRNLREEPTREEIMLTSLAISLRGMVKQGSISQRESDRQLVNYKQRLQRNPFPPEFQIFMSARDPDRAAIIAAHPIVEYCQTRGLKLRRQGREWACLCPLHEEHTPSFMLNPEKQLFHCHGCGAGGSVIDLHAALQGIPIADAMRELGGNQRRQQRSRQEVATYIYRDEDGHPLFEVVRFAPKDFRQFRLDEKGQRIWRGGMGDTRRVPYRLPELLLADEVIVVEGEKDVDVITGQTERVATCNPMGAGKWRAEYARYLKDKCVYVVPDQDEAGRQHANDVARSLVGVARAVMIVDLPEGVKDVAELAEANGQIFSEQLSALLSEARPFEVPSSQRYNPQEDPPSEENDPPPPPPPPQREAPPPGRVYHQLLEELCGAAAHLKLPSDRVVSELREMLGGEDELPALDIADQFCAEADDTPPEVIEGILHQGSKGELGGGSKTFKTWTLLQMGGCVSHGIPWIGHNTHAGEVLYINFELPRWSIRKRVKQICHALEVDPPSNLKLLNLRGYAADANVILPRIAKEIRKHRFVLIIIDPLYKILGDREENLSKDMANLMLAIERLAVDSNAAVFFGAHFSKGNQSLKEAMDRISGSGVLARDPDTIMTMTQHEEKEAYTVDMVLRNFAPQAPFVIQREHPLMVRADELDPSRLKKPRKSNQAVYSSEILLEVLEENGGRLAYNDWRKKCHGKAGLSTGTFFNRFRELRTAGRIFCSEIDEKWGLKP